MTSLLAIRIAAVSGFLAVALGAFGAHALEERLETSGRTDTWETAVLYHFAHTIVLLVLALRPKVQGGPFLSFLAGIIIFSGSLYALAFTDIGKLGAITPIGGLLFLAGWAWLIASPSSDRN